MTESKIELTERLRREGRWAEASRFKDTALKEFRSKGMKRAEAGYLHVLRHDGPMWSPWRRTIRTAVRMMQREPGPIDFARLAAQYQGAVTPGALARLVGLADIVRRYALESIDAAADDQVSDSDEILLRLLADRRRNLETPQARELLAAAVESDPNVFRGWTAKGVANALRRYGIGTILLHGRRVYRTALDALARVQVTYRLTLGIDETQKIDADGPQ